MLRHVQPYQSHNQGKFDINRLYKDVINVKGEYDTIVMACTADAYYDTLQQLSLETLQSVKHVILISPTFGSQMIVEQSCTISFLHLLSKRGLALLYREYVYRQDTLKMK
jgi:hypothetical protein